MEAVTARIAELRDMLGLSQQEFAEAVGITQGALSQLESGKSTLSLSTIMKIYRSLAVDLNWLIAGNRENIAGDGDSLNPLALVTVKKNNQTQQKVKIEGLIPLVKEEAHAGYIKSCHDLDFVSMLDVYKIPGYENGNYRLFEVQGDSMIPTIYPGEIVVSQFVTDWQVVESGTLCIIIMDEGIVAKRLYLYDEDKSVAVLKSDNASYKTYTVALDDVIELWEVKAKITSVFAQEHLLDSNKIAGLEADIKELKKQMKTLVSRSKPRDSRPGK